MGFVLQRKSDGKYYTNRRVYSYRRWGGVPAKDRYWTDDLSECKPYTTRSACKQCWPVQQLGPYRNIKIEDVPPEVLEILRGSKRESVDHEGYTYKYHSFKSVCSCGTDRLNEYCQRRISFDSLFNCVEVKISVSAN